MNLKNIALLGVALAAPVALSGCIAVAAPYGGVFTDTTVPVANFSSTDYIVDKGDYTVLGPTEGVGEYINVLGLIAIGDAGYQGAFSKACLAKGADNLIDAKTDVKIFSVLGIFARVNYRVTGIAVKRK